MLTSVDAWPAAAMDAERVQAELTGAVLDRVGAGSYRVVYGSPGWVVKVDRSFRSSVAIVMAVHLVESLRAVGGEWGRRPGGRVPGLAMDPGSLRGRTRAGTRHALVALLRACLTMVPEVFWRTTRAVRHVQESRGALVGSAELLPRLDGSGLVPPRLELPATRVRTRWRRSFVVTAAFRRVDRTLVAHLRVLARRNQHAEIEALLDRFLDYQVRLWRRGVFTADAVPFVNYGVLDGRIVLLDEGALSDDPLVIRRFLEIREAKLAYVEEVLTVLTSRELAIRFRGRLGRLLTVGSVRRHWPSPADPRWEIGGRLAAGPSSGGRQEDPT